MVNIIRLVKGYVDFEVSGGFPERFLNLCRLRGVDLHSVEVEGDRIRASADAREFRGIDEIAERSGMEVQINRRRGLPFFLKRHKWRCGVLVGIGVVVSFIAFMSGFIWDVEIVGDDAVKNLQLQQALSDLGVYSGARKSRIDILKIQEQILLSHEDINWISLNIFGTRAVVEYTPVREKLPVTDKNTPMNIVASKRGQITLLECYNGERAVKEGDYVSEGDLLISGVVVNGDGSERITHADGRVFARTENEHKYEQPLVFDGLIISSADSSYALNLFGLGIPVGMKNREEDSSRVYMNIRGNDTELPVGLVRLDGFSCAEQKISLSAHQAELMCISASLMERRSEYSSADIESVTYYRAESDDLFTLRQTIICVENIAREEEFYVEEN